MGSVHERPNCPSKHGVLAAVPVSMLLLIRSCSCSPDALVRERETGDLYVISWKTRATGQAERGAG